MTKKDQAAVDQIRALYREAFANRNLKFRFQKNRDGLFEILAHDYRGSAVIVPSVATFDIAELLAHLLMMAATASAKQIDLFTSPQEN